MVMKIYSVALTIISSLFVLPVMGDVPPVEVRVELERIEDLRILKFYSVQNLHDAKALAGYLQGWGGPNREGEVESLMREAEDVYFLLRGVEHGAITLQVELDALKAASAEQLALVQRARRGVAARVNDFHRRSVELRAGLAHQARAAAAEKVQWQVVSEPLTWEDTLLDAERAGGFKRGVSFGDNVFQFGNREEYPDDTLNYILDKAAKAGINYAELFWNPLSNWAELEPEAGAYSFDRVDAVLARFHRRGIHVNLMLSSLSGAPPAWHIEAEGDNSRFISIVRDRQGNESKQVSGINIFHEATEAAYSRFVAAYARHLAGNWGGMIDAIYIEGGQAEVEAPADVSPAMHEYWRKWSGTETSWRTPEEIRRDTEASPLMFTQAGNCREDWLADYINRVAVSIRQGWPDAVVLTQTVNDDFHRMQAKHTGRSRDLYRLASHTDIPTTKSTSPASLQLLRSFGRGRRIWAYGSHSGSGTTPAACFAESIWHDLTRMVGGRFVGNTVRLDYPPAWARYGDRQFGTFGIGSFIMAPRRTQELAPVALNTSTPAAEIALLWSQHTRRHDHDWQFFQSALAWGHMLRRVFHNFDYVSEHNLAEVIDGYRVLVLPNTQYMDDVTAEVIRRWVRGGGVLLGFGAPGLFDENGMKRNGMPLSDVFGADVARMRVPGPIQPDLLETTHSEGSFTFGNPPPKPYKFETNLTSALQPANARVRAWFAGDPAEPAIVEHEFGEGRAMLCGFPLGFEYWESAVYECTYGLTHSRHTNYNLEQKRYEAWITGELDKLGIRRDLILPSGTFLRAQRGDDPDWSHVYRNSPTYASYMWEQERPVRTVAAYLRRRDGIDNTYIGLSHTEGNYFSDIAYFRCFLTGGNIDVSVVSPGEGAVVFDARLDVPVPSTPSDERIQFRTWLPIGQSAAFAAAPGGAVRLFGKGNTSGASQEEIAARTATYESGDQMSDTEILHRDDIAAFLDSLAGESIVIGCGDTTFRPVAETFARWLADTRGIQSRITIEGPRASCRFDYMDSFGWPHYGDDPVHAHVLIGNAQDNGLMFKFLRVHGNHSWLALEVNQRFPGLGKGVVMLSSPVLTGGNSHIVRQNERRQLVVGSSFPAEAMKAVEALME